MEWAGHAWVGREGGKMHLIDRCTAAGFLRVSGPTAGVGDNGADTGAELAAFGLVL